MRQTSIRSRQWCLATTFEHDRIASRDAFAGQAYRPARLREELDTPAGRWRDSQPASVRRRSTHGTTGS